METIITVKNKYDSLDKLFEVLRKQTPFECSKEYDIWELRTDSNGGMEHCILIKKNGMHAVKLFLTDEYSLKVTYLIPNKILHAYFGKSEKRYVNILELIMGKIKDLVLVVPQEKAFNELKRFIIKAT